MPAMNYARVAQYYDLYARTDIDVPFFSRQARGCRNVLELTSGTGRLSLPLLEGGVNLSCLDSSPEMLEILRAKLHAKGLRAPVYTMDVVSFSLNERYDLVIFPFNSFAEISEQEQQISALQSIRRHMTAGGRFICTLHNPAARLRQVDGQTYSRGTFPLPGGGALSLASCERYDPNACRVSGEQVYELSDPAGRTIEKFSIAVSFALPDRQTFERLLRSQGFTVQALYGDYACSPYHPAESPFMIWILE